MNLDTYFSTPVWWDKLDIDADAIFNFCHRLKQSDPRGHDVSNVGGWQSKEFYYGDHPALTPLLNEILRRSKKCLFDFGYDEVNFETYMDNVWVNINRLNNYNKIHIHCSSFISGAYYVTDSNAQIEFYRNFQEQYSIESLAPISELNAINAPKFSYPARKNHLVMFPSWLPHSVEPNQEDIERISISFNIRIRKKGTAG